MGFTLAHLSDLHVTPVRVRSLLDLANKRALGWLSWRRRRRHEHRAEILEALLDDLEQLAPDHVAVTGDLTNVGLPEEIRGAVPWLERLGGPSRVSIVPGNHDAYASRAGPEQLSPWAPYLSDSFAVDAGGSDPIVAYAGAGAHPGFPYVRRAGPVALVGLCSAVPTAPGLATGCLGDDQLERLEDLLRRLGAAACCRIVLVHHPPVPAGQSRRRRLSDASALRGVLARSGAELVLHGHTHRTSFERVEGPTRPIPVIGVPSSSARGREAGRRARYHIYRVEPRGEGFMLVCGVRMLDGERGRFVAGPEHAL